MLNGSKTLENAGYSGDYDSSNESDVEPHIAVQSATGFEPLQLADSREVAFTELQERARHLKSQDISFIDNESFHEPDAWRSIVDAPYPQNTTVGPIPEYKGSVRYEKLPFPNVPVPTLEQEIYLFRKMNYLRCHASELIQDLSVEFPSPTAIQKIEECLEQSKAVEHHLIQGNLRFVVFMAKPFLIGSVQFDDLISEGCVALGRAVEGFDYAQGWRFGSYAGKVISNSLRQLTDQAMRRVSLGADGTSSLEELASSKPVYGLNLRQYDQLKKSVESLLHVLDERERTVLAGRFALGDREPQTLVQLAEVLGVTAEWVRQIEMGALRKLRERGFNPLDDLI